VLINYARQRNAKKREGNKNSVPFLDAHFITEQKAEELIKLDEALKQLKKMNERQAKVVECRYFVGYNIEETAKILDISTATVKRDWTIARSWLFSRISSEY